MTDMTDMTEKTDKTDDCGTRRTGPTFVTQDATQHHLAVLA
jgi:hypothetical protein